MNVNNNINLPSINTSSLKEEKKEKTLSRFECADKEYKSINFSALSAYSGISFKGRTYDGSNFREMLETEGKVQQVTITAGGKEQTLNLYRIKDSEFIILPDTNKIYKVKYTEDKNRIKQQILASELYRSVGIRTPEYIEFAKDGKTGYLSEVFEERLESAESNKRALYESFAADVWLGNRNGLNKDNTKIDKDGNIVKMTVSGSLGYRAAGMPKSDKFSEDISEINTLRDAAYNRCSAKLLENITEDDLAEAITALRKKYSGLTVEKITGSYHDNSMTSLLSHILSGRMCALESFIRQNKTDNLISKRGLNSPVNSDVSNIAPFNPDSGIDVENLMKISDEEWDILKKRGLLTANSQYRNFTTLDLSSMCKMTDEQHEIAKKRGIYASYKVDKWNSEAICGYDMAALCDMSDKDWKRVCERNLIMLKKTSNVSYASLADFIQKIINISDEDWKNVTDSHIMNIMFCSDEDINDFAELSAKPETAEFIPPLNERIRCLSETKVNGSSQCWINAHEALLLASVDNEKWQRAKDLTDNFKNLRLNSYSLYEIINLDNDDYKVLEKRGILKDVNSSSGLQELALLTDEEWANVQKRNLAEIRPDNLQDWSYLAALTDDEYQIVLDEHLLDNRLNNGCEEYFSGEDISIMVKSLSKKDWQNFEKRGLLSSFTVFNGFGIDLADAGIIIALSKLTDNDFEKFNEIKYKNINLYPSTIIDLCKLNETEFQRFWDRNLIKYHNCYEAWDNYSEDASVMKALAALSDEEYSEFLNQNNTCKTVKSKILIIKAGKLGLDKKHSLSEFTTAEKRSYFQLLLEQPEVFLDENFQQNFNASEIVPKTTEEYTAIMKKLLKSVGINSHPIDEKQKAEFFNALEALASPEGSFSKLDLKNTRFKIDVLYSKDDFINDAYSLISELDKNEQMKVFDYFGFDIHEDKYGALVMNGYPFLAADDEKLHEITREKTLEVIERLRPFVRKFTEDNYILPNDFVDEQSAEILNSIFRTLPELQTIVGKKQHHTHDYTLDVHTLAVLQECIKNPDFQSLKSEDKQTLMLAALLHDITKEENKRDSSHPNTSAYDAYYILEKLNIPVQQKFEIYQLIKNHDILSRCNTQIYDYSLKKKRPLSADELDKMIKSYAYELHGGNSAKLEMILTKSDLNSVKRDGSFYDRYSDVFNLISSKLAEEVNNIAATSIPLPQTKIPKASELKPDNVNLVEKVTYDSEGREIHNKVLYMSDGLDLEKLGFSKGVTTDNFSVLIHAFDDEMQQVVLDALDLPDKDALLSSSYVTYRKGNYHAFIPHGFIKEVLSDDVGAAYYKDFGSGYKKNTESLVSNYINGGNTEYRKYFSDLIKKELNLSDKEFIEFYNSIKNKSMEVIESENPKAARALKKIIDNMEISKRKYGRDYNEILIGRSKPVGVFFEGNDINGNKYDFENMPEFLRKYAEENDLPIIYFGE